MSDWHWKVCIAGDIERLCGKEIYKQYGQQILHYLERECSENWEITRYPEDEEVIKAANVIANHRGA